MVMRRTTLSAIAIAAALVLASPAHSDPVLEAYAGYWSGLGTVVMSSGTTEQVKCVAVYRVAGEQLRQNLRCASASYSINGSAEVAVKGNQVSGSWEEKTYSAVGKINGRMVGDGMSLKIESPNFGASMVISLTGCKQAIAIQPEGLDVSRISIAIAKC